MTGQEALSIIDRLLEQHQRGSLNTLQAEIVSKVWKRASYQEIGTELGYDPEYIKQVASHLWRLLSEKVSKGNLCAILQGYRTCLTTTNWGEAIDISHFNGRTAELELFGQWLSGEETRPCRLLAILGMGGIGKTSLAVKLAQQVRDDYQLVVWRSLKDAPPLPELLQDLIKVLSLHQDICLPERTGQQISKLMQYLQSTRCLIVLDNFETVLAGGQRSGTYLPGYEAYGELLLRVGEVPHSSCLILTSREKPAEVAALAGENLPVKSYVLSGIDLVTAKKILATKGISGSPTDTETLIQGYQGNPLALKIASTSIVDLFAGDIREFLEQGSIVFNGIRHLLTRQIDRLSAIETQIMYWLAIEREPITVSSLHADLQATVSRSSLLEALESLCWRSAIEKSNRNEAYFTLQPVIMEYMTDRLIDRMTQALLTGQVGDLNLYPLIKAQAKDYIRDSQIRVILDPIAHNLQSHFNNLTSIEQHCQELLVTLRQHYRNVAGYAAGNIINLLRHLNIDLTAYDFSHLAVRQAYLQSINLHQVNFSHANLADSRFSTALTNTLGVEFSPDGALLATSDANGIVRLWSVPEGRELQSFAAHQSWAFAVRFSPDGKLLGTCSGQQTIKLWNIATGECLRTFEEHTTVIWAICFSPNGQHLVSSGMDRAVKIWDIHTGHCLETLAGTGRAIAYNPDGTLLAFVGTDRTTIFVWDTQQQEVVHQLIGHSNTIWSMAFSPDGQILASGSEDRTVRLWHIPTQQPIRVLQGEQIGWVWAIAFSPDGSTLAVGNESALVSLWNTETGTCVQTLKGHTGHLWSIAFSPDGNLLASGAEDQAIRLWQVDRGYCLKTLQGYSSRVWSISTLPSSTDTSASLLVSALNQQIGLWNIATGTCYRILTGHIGEVYSTALHRDGNLLASGSVDGTVKIWDIHSGKCLFTFDAHSGWVFSVAFHPCQDILASGSVDGTIRFWDIHTGACIQVLEGHAGWVFSVAFSSDGQLLASGSSDAQIKIWDTTTWQCLQVLKGHAGWVFSVAFSADTCTLVSGSFDHTVRLWDIATGVCIRSLEGHTNPVSDAIYIHGGKQIASCSQDNTIKLWDLQTGDCLNTLEGHTDWIWQLALHPDGTTLISGSQDETVKLWNLERGECIATWRAPRPYEGMNIDRVSGLTDAQKATLKMLGAIEG
jgi:WD40 repeat protein